MKLSELIENLICLEGLEKEKKRENGAPTSKAFKDYTVYIALKNYELYNKDGSIGIYRFNEPNPKASVLRDRYGLVDFGFIDDLAEEDIELARELMQKAHEVVEEAKKHDAVNHPKHYTQGKVECIDALESATINKRGIEAVCTANIIKYLWRYESKNGIEDVKKAQWYLQKLISELEKQQKE